MADIAPNYNDGNRAFLQAFMARGTMTFEQARPVLAAILTLQEDRDQAIAPDDVTSRDFESYVSVASDAISTFDYEIRSTVHQITKERVYAMVNTTSDPMTQLATTYSAEEIAFTKRILDAMFETYNTPRMEVLCITGMQAIEARRPPRTNDNADEAPQTQGQDRGLKHSDVERMMENLVSEGWFEKSREGFFSLSPRALLELRSWLVDSYNDPDLEADQWQRVKFCEACKEIVTHGQRCGDVSCNMRLHDICEDAFWRTQRAKKCPKCSKDWDGKHFVGERAITSRGLYQNRRRSGGGRRNNLADEVMQQEEAGGEEDE